MNQNKKSNGPLYAYIVLFAAGFLLTMALFFNVGWYVYKKYLLFLLTPWLVFSAGKVLQSLIQTFFLGKAAVALGKVLHRLSLGLAVFVFMFFMPEAYPVNTASYGVLFLTLILAVYSLFFLIPQYIAITKGAKAFLYILMGMVMRFITVTLWDNGVWHIGFGISVADMVLWGFIFLAVITLLSLLELSENNKCRVLGTWLGKKYPTKFLFICGIIFVLKDVRTMIAMAAPQNTFMVEWIAVFIILLVAFVILMMKIQNMTRYVSHEELKSHTQEVIHNKGEDLRKVAAYIDEFVVRGDKSSILSYIIITAHEAKIPDEVISRMIRPLVFYRDLPLPVIYLRSEWESINERNMEARQKLVESAIYDVRNYGRKRA